MPFEPPNSCFSFQLLPGGAAGSRLAADPQWCCAGAAVESRWGHPPAGFREALPPAPWPVPDLPRHGYRSLRHLLGDMKELVVLDEEGKEPWVRCRHAACDLLPEAKTPKRRRHHPWIQKEAPPERQHPEAPKAGVVMGCWQAAPYWGEWELHVVAVCHLALPLVGGSTTGAVYTTRCISDFQGRSVSGLLGPLPGSGRGVGV